MNVRSIFHKSVLLLFVANLFGSCDQMHEDLSDCPTGLYVNFVYDYNIQRADMFKDHVGGLTLYVFDESDAIAAQRTVSRTELSRYGYNIHFSEDELAPGHPYRLCAVAMQKDWNQASTATGYKPEISNNRTSLSVTLKHEQGVPYGSVSDSAPLDTLWHTLTTLRTTEATLPAATDYQLMADGTAKSNGVETVSVIKGEPTYATVSLIRDTKHLTISLYELDEPCVTNPEDYEVFIVDANTVVDYQNNVVTPGDSVIYRPYDQIANPYIKTVNPFEGLNAEDKGQSAHFGLMFNRLMYNTTPDKNAVLCIRKRATGEQIAVLNLPYILCAGRVAYQTRSYEPQEYLDREHDYHLEFFLRGGQWIDLWLTIDVLSWAKRVQYVEFK